MPNYNGKILTEGLNGFPKQRRDLEARDHFAGGHTDAGDQGGGAVADVCVLVFFGLSDSTALVGYLRERICMPDFSSQLRTNCRFQYGSLSIPLVDFPSNAAKVGGMAIEPIDAAKLLEVCFLG